MSALMSGPALTWIAIGVVTLAAFAAMVLVLKLPRRGWELVGSALLFGLAGYALQGHPGLAGSPTPPSESRDLADAATTNAALVKQRQAMGDAYGSGREWLVLSDALVRQGQYGAAAEVLRKAAERSPRDADIWVAMGNALVGHSEGLITPAAQYAFRRAAAIDPQHPGPPFFMGMALAQTGHLGDARALWAALLARAPADAPWRADLAQRLQRLDMMLAEQQGAPQPDANRP